MAKPSENVRLTDDRTTGAWLIHHTQKLDQVTGVHSFQKILMAGKAGTLLSAVSGTKQTQLSIARVEALAAAANINALELPTVLDLLKKRHLVELKASVVEVLGVSGETVLQRTHDVFRDLKPGPLEEASLELAELASLAPIKHKRITEFLGDIFNLSSAQTSSLLEESAQIGFVDHEELDAIERVYFNGNLFRRADIKKINAVLNSVNSDDCRRVSEVEEQLKKSGCMLLTSVKRALGDALFEKLNAVSMYDVNVVSNSAENVAFVTRPAAFSKYGNAVIGDAFDLAKAFVSSLTYGRTRSGHARGRITMIGKLLAKLITGYWVGCVEAIGQDYRALETKGVIQVRPSARGGYEMLLLKREVGELALAVIQDGDASEHALLLPGGAVTGYLGPEKNREGLRRRQTIQSKRATSDIITALRTGGL